MPGALHLATLGLAVLTLIGLIITMNQPVTYVQPLQVMVLAILLTALTPMLFPITQMLGGGVLMPLPGDFLSYGSLPMLTWLVAGAVIGVMSVDRGSAVRASLLLTSLYYLIWITMTITILPNVKGTIYWSTYLDRVFTTIVTRTPLEIVAIYAAPLMTAVATDALLSLGRREPTIRKARELRYY